MAQCDDYFFGSATVGERGQIVIPAEARSALGIQPGDKLLILKHPVYQSLMVAKFEAMNDFIEGFKQNLARAADHEEDDS